MQRSSIAALALMVALTIANVSHATTFAILLESPEQPLAIASNPLYTADEKEVNPLFEDDVLGLALDPNELWQGAPARLEVLFTDSLPADLPPAPENSLVFGIFLFDQSTGNPIHRLRAPVTLAVEFDKPVDPNNFIFSSLNESTGTWGEFQKGKPKPGSGNTVCGTTDHFSYFYITTVPEPSTFALAVVASALCLFWRRLRFCCQ